MNLRERRGGGEEKLGSRAKQKRWGSNVIFIDYSSPFSLYLHTLSLTSLTHIYTYA
jgi:hypothetical protein